MTTESRISPLRHWRRFALLAMVLGACTFMPPALLEWSRSGLESYEYWRLLTGHWVHLGAEHLALNLAGLAIIGLLFRRHPPLTAWVAFLLISPVLISLGLLWLVPDLAWYRGFSGTLHGLLVYTAFFNLSTERRWSLLVLAVVSLKLALENLVYAQSAENSFIGGRVIQQAHGLGALTGALAGLLPILARKLFRKPAKSSPV
ncbi:rhombosortase [uncultured Marinobacter sp.]|uniref:rhombosortase n=1 Tax=uncultured Marinobacter sp. TaxID=187379 RepID=UPI00263826D7|nr:rhombosortase [uncultured Marinobacter sp.]